MKHEYDFEGGRRGPIEPVAPGKRRITIRIDTDVLEWFQGQAEAAGGGNYQTMINAALREHALRSGEPMEDLIRRVLREELERSG
jgi:uncharacterized protein (DUF4415 family)